MKWDCPYCGVSLKDKQFRSMLPGWRRALPNHAILYCPDCGGGLAISHSPVEKVQFGIILSPLLPLLLLYPYPKSNIPWILSGLSFALAAAAVVYLELKYQRDWQKFKPHEQAAR